MNTTRQLRFAFADGPVRETRLDRTCMRILETLAKGHDECWAATETIANKLGITVRAAQYRLDRLIKLGWVERVWDYTRETRRRLLLLGRKAKTCVNSVNEQFRVESTKTSALTPPLSPPIRSELSMEREIEVGENDNDRDPATQVPTGAGSSSSQEPPQGSGMEELARALLSAGVPPEALRAPAGPTPLAEVIGRALERVTTPQEPREAPRVATREQKEAVVEKAKKAFPHVPAVGWKVRALAKRRHPDGTTVGLQWVDWALDWAIHRKAVSWKFMLSTVADWCENGYSGPPVKRTFVMQNYNPPAPVDTSPPTAEDVAGLELLAAGNGPAARLARTTLARIRGEGAAP